jgi:nitroimidazol reductase NimA-like FMN-containing flavoprotein (pyridoxamine 5'-phosphate oxidase superfamily)
VDDDMTDDETTGWLEPRTGLGALSEDECWERLAAAAIGRVGVIAGREPLVLPVNFALDGRRIVFRTGAGTKFHAVVHDAVLALEIDEVDESYHMGWSVLAVGQAREVVDADEIARLTRELPLRPWAGGDKSHWVVMTPSRVTGRSLVPGAPL